MAIYNKSMEPARKKAKICFSLPPFISRWNALLMGLPVVNGHSVLSFQPPFICKTSSGGTNAEGRFESNLGSTAERWMRGCSVIVNRLIDNVFWLSCKDERKKRNDRLSEGDSIFPYIKNIPSFLKKMVMFLRNLKVFFENIKVFLQHAVRAVYL